MNWFLFSAILYLLVLSTVKARFIWYMVDRLNKVELQNEKALTSQQEFRGYFKKLLERE